MSEPNERDFPHNETYDERERVEREWEQARVAVAGREMATLGEQVAHILDQFPDQSKRIERAEVLLGSVARFLSDVSVNGQVDEERMKAESEKLNPALRELVLQGGEVLIRVQRGTDIPAPYNGTAQLVDIFSDAAVKKEEPQ